MCQKERNPCRPAASIRATRERLAFVLVLLFLIVLLTAVFFPQSAANTMLPYAAGLLALAMRFYYRAHNQEKE
jgi:uncharacterized membrane-anchored protein